MWQPGRQRGGRRRPRLRGDRQERFDADGQRERHRGAHLSTGASFEARRLAAGDVGLLRQLNALFAEAFGESETYLGNPPDEDYCREILADPSVILLAATTAGRAVGGIGAYRLRKFEQARSEIYIYDLAVAADMRRQGIATALIGELRRIARETDCWMTFVQGEAEDEAAIALYRKLAVGEEEALHFDIAP